MQRLGGWRLRVLGVRGGALEWCTVLYNLT